MQIFNLNIRFQLVSLVVLLVIIMNFYRNQRLKLLSTKFFSIALWTTFINICLDMGTVYTISHIEQVTPFVNRLVHQGFILSVIGCMYANTMYVMSLGYDQKRLSGKKMVLSIVPIAISLLVVIFGSLEYYVSGSVAYSHGTMANAVYSCGFLYLLAVFVLSFDPKMTLTRKQRYSIRIAMIFWIVPLLIQILFPQLLLSGTGVVLLMLIIYMTFENQKEYIDSETGCFNRSAFHRMMLEYHENKKNLYLVNIVCDNYERINTVLGHENGIQALKAICQTIQHCYAKDVYHSRSSVFTVFTRENPLLKPEALEKLCVELKHIPYYSAHVKFHIDVLDCRRYSDTIDEAYEIINFMARNSLAEEGAVCELDESIISRKRRRDRIDQLLTEAMENHGFEMFYQPIYWPETGKIQSAEALIRMKADSELGYISPEEFIPIAEEKGLILEIGDQVLEMVAAFVSENHLQGSELRYIEVNLSGLQVVLPDIDMRLIRILDRYGVAPSFINLEITETATISSEAILQTNMTRLKKMGFSFSMDDFGTGYSNLAQMNNLAYDLIKIDKSLLWPAFGEEPEKPVKMLEMIISMLRQMDFSIVAEGVETKAMADFLTEKGVQHLQGYYFSKPIAKEAFLEMLANQ